MPIVEKLLQDALFDIAKAVSEGDGTRSPEEVMRQVADEKGTEISNQILTLTVTVPAGIPVTVATAVGPGTGATTAPIVATLS